MALSDLGLLVIGIAGVAIAAALVSGAPALFAAVFRSPIDLGWPAGVQEDDDMRWSWHQKTPEADESQPDPGEGPSYEARPTRLHPRVTHP
jgi:hypothetical protein